MPPFRSFASDNNSGVHPEVMAALAAANTDHARAYGHDAYTARADAVFARHFGPRAQVYFVFLGTAANVLALKALAKPWHGVICAETAHINTDECGAPEANAHVKLLDVATPDGKLTPELLDRRYCRVGDEHRVQPKVVSITQASELGTVYTPEEIRVLADYAHQRGMYLHMDGARIANAAVHLGCELRDMTSEAGVDVLSFGGTKNGLMFGEAVVFLDPSLGAEFRWLRKQAMQLVSKMRYIAVQFEALLEGDLWRRNAAHANAMATRLAQGLEGIPGLTLTQPVQANALFPQLPLAAMTALQREYYFYTWDEAQAIARWMTSYDSTVEEVDAFAAAVGRVMTAEGAS